MTAPSRRAARTRLGVGAALGFLIGVVTGTLWSWDASGVVLLAALCAGLGYYVMLWSVILQSTAAARRIVDGEPLNVPVGL